MTNNATSKVETEIIKFNYLQPLQKLLQASRIHELEL